jgi:hypothetical protein
METTKKRLITQQTTNNNFHISLFTSNEWRVSERDQLSVRVIVFNATFKNISVISWQSVLLEKKPGVPGKHYRSVVSH